TATRLTGSSPASVVAVASPRSASRLSTRQRVGSARAAITVSAPASIGCSDGDALGVVAQVADLDAPAPAVVLVALALLRGLGIEGGEAAFDDAQAGAIALGVERELHERRVALDGVGVLAIADGDPAVREAAVGLDVDDAPADGAVLLPAEAEGTAGTEVDLGARVAEPAAEVLGFGQQRPDALDGRGDEGLSFDLLGNHVAASPSGR